MDATQMIDDSILESDEEVEEIDRGDPLGKLCILKNPHIPEKECPLYLGENVLGRDPNTCSLSFPAPSVSKQHATISLSVYRRRGSADQVEALLWDMGSMNGTRKGHLKLTPNVRYALSYGDALTVADIPCKYKKCNADVQVTRTPVTPDLKTKDVLRENGGNLNTSKSKSPAVSTIKDATADAGGTRGTPARTGGLSFEQTPTQPQSSLVPDSESESEEDKPRAGHRMRKTIASVSDSSKSSPVCSTFMTPTNKVVPESEDESPITPSSSYKNRTHRVSINTDESDGDLNRQEQKKIVPLDIVDDSEGETGKNNKTSLDKSCAQSELSKVERDASIRANAVSEFNMDSDTDVEEEGEKLTVANGTTTTTTITAATTALTSSNAQPEFHMDSDTDVEENDDNKPAISSNKTPKNSQNVQPVCSMDSDTDVEEEEEKLTVAKAATTTTTTAVTTSNSQPEFHMDSDTDVEDNEPAILSDNSPKNSQTAPVVQPFCSMDSDTDVEDEEEKLTAATTTAPVTTNNFQSSNESTFNPESDTDVEDDDFASRTTAKPEMPKMSADPNDFNLDSDTDVDEEEADVTATPSRLDAKSPSSKPPQDPQLDSDADGNNKPIIKVPVARKPSEGLEISSNSDTDVEDDSPDVKPTTSGLIVAGRKANSVEDTGLNEAVVRSNTGDKPASVSEDGENEITETGDDEIPVLQREITPGIRGALSKNCSTPKPQQEGKVEEMETQAFLSPSVPAHRLTPVRTAALSSCSSQEDDYVVAETQSFILNDKTVDPNISTASDSSLKERDVSNTSAGNFQLELSETSVLQSQAQALAMESTQAYITANLEETQPYADAIITDKKNAPVDIALQATQAYIPTQDSDEEEESADGGQERELSESRANNGEEEEAMQPVEFLSGGAESALVFTKKKQERIQEEATQNFTDVAAAPTQLMVDEDDSEMDEEAEVFSKKISEEVEEETEPNSDLTAAQTVPMEMQDDSETDEGSAVFTKKKVTKIQEDDTQENSDFIFAQTVPMEMPEESESDDDDDNPGVFRRKTAKQLQSEEEETQRIERPKDEGSDDDDDDDSGPMFRKKKVKPVDRIQETQSSLESEVTMATTQPIITNEESAEEDAISVGRKRTKKRQKQANSEFTVAPTQPVVLSEDEEEEDDTFPSPRRRKTRKLEDTQSLNSQDAKGEEEASDVSAREASDVSAGEASDVSARATRGGTRLAKKVIVEAAKRQTRGTSKATRVSKRRRGRGKVETEEENEEEEEQGENKMAAELQREKEEKEMAARIQKEKEEREMFERQKREEEERLEKEQKEREEMERLEKERIEQEKKELAAKLQKEKEEREQRKREERERREKEEMEKLEKERIEQEKKELAAKLQKEKEEREQREREERERREKEKMEKLEKERIKQEKKELAAKLQKEKEEREQREREERERREKEEMEKLEKERIEQEKKELAAKLQKEKEERKRKENERLEKERIKQEKKEQAAKLKKEKEEKKQREKLEREKREREERERLEAAKKAEEEEERQREKEERERLKMEEKERLEKEKQKEEDQAARRGRKTGRRTIAVPESSSTVAEEDDVPAKRTRSRSNSSNSVGSERSVSSNVSQTTRGRGRGRGGRTSEVQTEKAPSRGRRRTVATTKVSPPSPPGTLSRSNSNMSLNSELSVSSVSSRERGRGGRQRGRGRKSETERPPSGNDSQKGRKSTRICLKRDEEDEGDDSRPSVSTRGKPGAKDGASETPEHEEEQRDEKGRGGRTKQVEIKKEAETAASQVEEKPKDISLSSKRKTAAKDSSSKTPENEEEQRDTSTSTERRRGRTKQVEIKNESETAASQAQENHNDTNLSGKRKAAVKNPPVRKSTEVTEDDAKPDKPKAKGRGSTAQAKNPEERDDGGSSANNSMEQEETPRSSVSRKRSSTDSESDPLAKTPRSSSASPSSARSRAASQVHKVLFTGVVDDAGEKVLSRLGGSIAKDVSDMNCLVTDKVRRTVKFLCAVAKGIPIVTTQWLEKSGKAGTFLPSSAYLVKDREQENKFDFNLQDSLKAASGQPLLQGYQIHVTKSVKPEPVHMKDIISCSGAVFLPRMPSANKPNTVVVSCEDDWPLCSPAVSCGVPVVSSEFILTGILQQKLDLEKHKLQGPVCAPTTGGRGRGRKKT